MVGHQNNRQKIHLHQRVKNENDELRKEKVVQVCITWSLFGYSFRTLSAKIRSKQERQLRRLRLLLNKTNPDLLKTEETKKSTIEDDEDYQRLSKKYAALEEQLKDLCRSVTTITRCVDAEKNDKVGVTTRLQIENDNQENEEPNMQDAIKGATPATKPENMVIAALEAVQSLV